MTAQWLKKVSTQVLAAELDWQGTDPKLYLNVHRMNLPFVDFQRMAGVAAFRKQTECQGMAGSESVPDLEQSQQWYLTTVAKSGGNHVTQACNLLSNVWNQSRGAVLVEPFSWTVIQGVILVFIIVNSQL